MRIMLTVLDERGDRDVVIEGDDNLSVGRVAEALRGHDEPLAKVVRLNRAPYGLSPPSPTSPPAHNRPPYLSSPSERDRPAPSSARHRSAHPESFPAPPEHDRPHRSTAAPGRDDTGRGAHHESADPTTSPTAALWRNGQLLDSRTRARAVLHDGDRIALSESLAHFTVTDEPGGVAEIRVVGGPGAGIVHRLGLGVHVIGSDDMCAIAVPDRSLSPETAVLRITAETITIEPVRHARPTLAPRRKLKGRYAEDVAQLLDRAESRAPKPPEDPSDLHLDAAPLTERRDWPEHALLTCGSSVFALTAIESPDAHLAPRPEGGVAYNRPPRLRRAEPERRFERPREPTRAEGLRLQLLAALLPLIIGLTLAYFLHQWYFLLIALMSPVIMFGQWWSDRRHGRKQHRRAMREHLELLADYDESVEHARRQDELTRRSDAPDAAEVLLTATGPRRRLWERRIHDPDALRLRVGLADLPANLELSEERGSAIDPPTCRAVPVALPMRRLGVAGVTGAREVSTALVSWLIGQAATLHSPRDLAVVILSAHSDGESRWGWARWLPHCAAPGLLAADSLVLAGTDPETAARRVAELTSLIDERLNTAIPELGKIPTGWDDLGGPATPTEPAFATYDERPFDVLVILDGAQVLRGLPGMPQVLRQGPRAGVYTLAIDDDQRLLPEECATVATCGDDDHVRLRGGGLDTLGPILADQVSASWCDRLARALAPIRDVSREDQSAQLPTSARLLDLLALPTPTPDEIASRWPVRGTTSAQIGIGPEGPYSIDLTQDGPHALIAGTTGAGKSELLQTLICSLAVANRPDQLTFVLIDYKGGAAFNDCVRLPHTVGMVTDLDGHLTKRALDSLAAEIRRRERLLLAAGAKDIDDYLDKLHQSRPAHPHITPRRAQPPGPRKPTSTHPDETDSPHPPSSPWTPVTPKQPTPSTTGPASTPQRPYASEPAPFARFSRRAFDLPRLLDEQSAAAPRPGEPSGNWSFPTPRDAEDHATTPHPAATPPSNTPSRSHTSATHAPDPTQTPHPHTPSPTQTSALGPHGSSPTQAPDSHAPSPAQAPGSYATGPAQAPGSYAQTSALGPHSSTPAQAPSPHSPWPTTGESPKAPPSSLSPSLSPHAPGSTASHLEPLPRLVLIIDEFAALVTELPDFVTGLVDIARRGRSLGVHLILATQRPAGVVTADIQANTSLRIALRVTEPSESTDVIDVPDAAHILRSTPGRCYVRSGVGAATAVQTARIGGRATTSTTRGPVRVSELTWRTLGRPLPPPRETTDTNDITDLAILVDAVADAARLTNTPNQPTPWLDPLPTHLVLDLPAPLTPSHSSTDLHTPGPFPFGVTDLPWAQERRPLTFDLEHGGHLLIAGSARSGRSTALRTLAGSIAATASPADVHLHAIDCGSGALLPLVAMPHCGAVVTRDQLDRVERLLTRLRAEVGHRQQLLAEAGHASLSEYRQAGNHLPWLILMLDRWEGYVAAFEGYDYGKLTDALLQLLREGAAVGLRAIVTGDRSALIGQVSTVFDDRLLLRLSDPSDYALAGFPAKDLPTSMPPGRALTMGEQGMEESQIALLTPDPSGPAQVAVLQTLARQTWPADTLTPAPTPNAPAAAGTPDPNPNANSATAMTRATSADPPPHDRRPGTATPTPWPWRGEPPLRVDSIPNRITASQALDLQPGFTPPSPLWALVGVGGDALTPMGIDLLAQGPGAVVAGPPRSGRSSVLVTAARSLIAQGTPVIAVVPRRSPLRDLEGARAVLDGNGIGLQELITDLDSYVVIVDDAELINPDAPLGLLLDEILRTGRDGDHGLILAGATGDLSTAYRGFVAEARKPRTGLLLAVQSPADGDLFTVRLPRGAVGGPPGRGLLLTMGTVTPIQAALPDPSPL
ncbi:FtsK/SpoIIIE domain-containing protein [Nonomuraea sp. NPDC050663]|uniref:FtsK/SpoIIIE domain-containing protein n=1 Tax=Nonomuraea sp. NPDC050663 TaxID=3364370 RepID=UPI00379B52C6